MLKATIVVHVMLKLCDK